MWIVFDELSYDQVYEDRANGLALPNFDALRSEGTVFTNAQPIGDKTVKILPSLLSGQVIDKYDFTFDNRLLVHDRGTHGYKQLDGSGTVFADAQKNGWRTAAVGWYNPYCTVYADAIDDCYWMNLDRMDGPMAQDASFWSNVGFAAEASRTADRLARARRRRYMHLRCEAADEDLRGFGSSTPRRC